MKNNNIAKANITEAKTSFNNNWNRLFCSRYSEITDGRKYSITKIPKRKAVIALDALKKYSKNDTSLYACLFL